ncbi:hypothetical protein SSPO_023920 [Streptomyces antimycoticus]|uniref:Uncharacterized protein n=1 Tax=Streptomyces antimycoticus TaxID=68175 RepID=A0A499UEE6_9ACTN|nr:hypothetical protein SSPO_023920 [Streptomyces antimycoticus]
MTVRLSSCECAAAAALERLIDWGLIDWSVIDSGAEPPPTPYAAGARISSSP